ncbi:hypothetical protein DUI87_04738 [Hirundo rustica rustica]|uniref:Uncharacterized protein n=1 Tax=Hirundo rustica rustica TaxID=333673 RepID=A0A3M0KZV4_HIRRU|nr:hypothetical protein DUI87_04738 [Hirundo rustica rustica]
MDSVRDGSVDRPHLLPLGKLLGFPEPRRFIPAGLFLLFEAYDIDIDVFDKEQQGAAKSKEDPFAFPTGNPAVEIQQWKSNIPPVYLGGRLQPEWYRIGGFLVCAVIDLAISAHRKDELRGKFVILCYLSQGDMILLISDMANDTEKECTPIIEWDAFHYPKLLQAPSNLALDTSRDPGVAKASLGNLCQDLIILTGKIFFPISNLT